MAGCHGNGATADEHVGDLAGGEGGLEVEVAGPEYFDSLLEDDGLPAPDEAVADEPGDGAMKVVYERKPQTARFGPSENLA